MPKIELLCSIFQVLSYSTFFFIYFYVLKMDKSIERDAPVPSVRSSTGGLTEELDISDIGKKENGLQVQ